ncbi:MAG: 5-bromo-4-chloroindolyl phosphate hydrolysis family protein [Pseudomonadota bacterium]
MRTVSTANRIAMVAAGVAVALSFGFLRLRGVPILLGAGVVYVGTLAMFWPRRKRSKPVVLPEGVDKTAFAQAEQALAQAAELLNSHARLSHGSEAALFTRMATLVGRIHTHLRGNPLHLAVIQRFIRHGLAHLIQMVTDFADLKRRALPEHEPRLTQIFEQIEALVPMLEAIDRACIERDLAALEVSVEVMAERTAPPGN